MRRSWHIIVVGLLAGILLSACSPNANPAPALETSPTAVQTETVIQSPAQGEAVYPAPEIGSPAYPPPGQGSLVFSLYPGPSEGVTNYLDWAKVEELILGGKVSKVYHSQSMHITLVLKDGSVAITTEPALEEVFKVIERCGQACSDIEQIKE